MNTALVFLFLMFVGAANRTEGPPPPPPNSNLLIQTYEQCEELGGKVTQMQVGWYCEGYLKR